MGYVISQAWKTKLVVGYDRVFTHLKSIGFLILTSSKKGRPVEYYTDRKKSLILINSMNGTYASMQIYPLDREILELVISTFEEHSFVVDICKDLTLVCNQGFITKAW